MTQFATPLTDDDYEIVNGRRVLKDGRRMRMDITMMDSASSGPVFLTDTGKAASIDEAVHEEIKAQAKVVGQKPSQWLSENSGTTLEKLIASVAQRFVERAGGAGVTAAFNLDGKGGSFRDPNFGRMLRDVALAARNGGSAAVELARISKDTEQVFADTQARLSEERRNAWRGHTADAEAVRDAARFARYK